MWDAPRRMINKENLLRGYKGVAEVLKITPRSARRIVDKYNITKYHPSRNILYFDYKEVYVKYILNKNQAQVDRSEIGHMHPPPK